MKKTTEHQAISEPAANPAELDEAKPASASADDKDALRENIIEALKTIYDPEIPVNIYELGLIYTIDINENNEVRVEMTLTSPGCPVAQSLPLEVSDKVETVEGVANVKLEMVWDPPWSTDRMSEAAKLQLGMF